MGDSGNTLAEGNELWTQQSASAHSGRSGSIAGSNVWPPAVESSAESWPFC